MDIDAERAKAFAQQAGVEIAEDTTRKHKLRYGVELLKHQMLDKGQKPEEVQRDLEWMSAVLGTRGPTAGRITPEGMKLRLQVEKLAFGDEKEKRAARTFLQDQSLQLGGDPKETMEMFEKLADGMAKNRPEIEREMAERQPQSREAKKKETTTIENPREEDILRPPVTPGQEKGPDRMR